MFVMCWLTSKKKTPKFVFIFGCLTKILQGLRRYFLVGILLKQNLAKVLALNGQIFKGKTLAF